MKNATVKSNFNIKGSNATSVSSDASGNITIDSLNSWRIVEADVITGGVPVSTSLGVSNLVFGDEFLWKILNLK